MSAFVLSCTTCALRGAERDEILACFSHAPAAGYKYWGLAGAPLVHLGGATWFDARRARELADRAGFEGCTEVYGPSFPTDSIAAAEDAAEDVARMFDVAAVMDSPLVVFSGGNREGAGGIEASIAGICKLLTLIEDGPVRMALEPHYNSRFMTRQDFDAIFAAIDDPRVGITVDTGHFHSAGVDWKGLICDYREKIYNIHLKDHEGTQSVPIGRGGIDLRGLIETLHEIDYEGALAVELEVVDPENLPRYIVEAYNHLSGLVREVSGRPPAA